MSESLPSHPRVAHSAWLVNGEEQDRKHTHALEAPCSFARVRGLKGSFGEGFSCVLFFGWGATFGYWSKWDAERGEEGLRFVIGSGSDQVQPLRCEGDGERMALAQALGLVHQQHWHWHWGRYISNIGAYKLPRMASMRAVGGECFDTAYYLRMNDDLVSNHLPEGLLWPHFVIHGRATNP
jgi:hypothetical protein